MDYHRPTTVDEVLAALASDPDATILAGGTDLMVEVNFGHANPRSVVSLRDVADLDTFDGSSIGGGVTYASMERGPIPALAEAARTVGSPQIRSVGTIGGNVATASPAGDTLPVIAALDGSIVLGSTAGTRTLPWHDFFTGVKATARRPDELVVSVDLPDDPPPAQAFSKIGVRNAMVISMVSACVTRRDDGSTTVAMGAVAPTPIRAHEAEAFIAGVESPDGAALDRFTELVRSEVRPISDHRGTEAYRRHAAGVIARRALVRCLEQLQGDHS